MTNEFYKKKFNFKMRGNGRNKNIMIWNNIFQNLLPKVTQNNRLFENIPFIFHLFSCCQQSIALAHFSLQMTSLETYFEIFRNS